MAETAATGGYDSRYGYGIACLLTATLFTSTAGILLRLIEQADGWQVLFYRSVSFVAVTRARTAASATRRFGSVATVAPRRSTIRRATGGLMLGVGVLDAVNVRSSCADANRRVDTASSSR